MTLKSFVYRLLIGIYHKSVTSQSMEQTTHSSTALLSINKESFVVCVFVVAEIANFYGKKYGNLCRIQICLMKQEMWAREIQCVLGYSLNNFAISNCNLNVLKISLSLLMQTSHD